MGILLAKYPVWLRAVDLKDKPAEMLAVSPTGTVPLLLIDQATLIDESLDIMVWVLQKSDPNNLLVSENPSVLADMLNLINEYDNEFKSRLEKYKCAKRYHENNRTECRQQCEQFIAQLEKRLTSTDFIMGNKPSLVDYAILPFIRQFARVERQWYLQSPYPNVRQWLNKHLQSPLFSKTMTKYPLWLERQESFLIG